MEKEFLWGSEEGCLESLLAETKKKERVSDKTPNSLNPEMVEYWERKLDQGNPLWFDLKPFSETNDPLWCIPTRLRQELVRRVEITPERAESFGMDRTQWEKRFISERDSFLAEKLPWLKRVQLEAVSMYSEDLIALKKKVELYNTRALKRGERGNLLSLAAIELFPDGYQEKFRAALGRREGNLLCHVSGIVCVLHEDLVRYPKK